AIKQRQHLGGGQLTIVAVDHHIGEGATNIERNTHKLPPYFQSPSGWTQLVNIVPNRPCYVVPPFLHRASRQRTETILCHRSKLSNVSRKIAFSLKSGSTC